MKKSALFLEENPSPEIEEWRTKGGRGTLAKKINSAMKIVGPTFSIAETAVFLGFRTREPVRSRIKKDLELNKDYFINDRGRYRVTGDAIRKMLGMPTEDKNVAFKIYYPTRPHGKGKEGAITPSKRDNSDPKTSTKS